MTLDPEHFPRIVLISRDRKTLLLSDDQEININDYIQEFVSAYNDLRDAYFGTEGAE